MQIYVAKNINLNVTKTNIENKQEMLIRKIHTDFTVYFAIYVFVPLSNNLLTINQ